MDPSHTFSQPGFNSSEKSENLQSHPPPPQPVFQGNPPVYTPSYPSQPVLQAAYVQAQYPVQSVVTFQPAVYVTAVPGARKVQDYLGYSIFTMLCCFLPLGIAALIFSCATRDAIFAGQRELAEKNSRTTRILNHIALGFGIFCHIILIIIIVMVSTRVY